MGLTHSHDETVNAHYFKDENQEDGVFSARQEVLGSYTVILDYDAAGNVIGVELI